MIESYTIGWTLYILLGITSIALIKGYYSICKGRSYIIILFCVIFFLMGSFGNAITPDYSTYGDLISIIKSTKDPSTHLEGFWIDFIRITGCNYLNYRIVLFLFMYLIFGIILLKFKECNIIILISIYSLVFIVSHIGLRASLFLMIFTLGLLELSKKNIIKAIILFSTSFFIHKVSYFAIPILALTLIIPVNNKRLILLFIILLSIISLSIHFYITSNFSAIIDYMWQNGITGSSYLEREESVSDRGNIIWRIIDYTSSFGLYVLKIMILTLLHKYYKSLYITQKIMYGTLLWSTILSLAILMIGLPDRTLSYRCSTIGDIPMCFLWASLPVINVSIYKKYKKYLLIIISVIFILQNIFIRGLYNRI